LPDKLSPSWRGVWGEVNLARVRKKTRWLRLPFDRIRAGAQPPGQSLVECFFKLVEMMLPSFLQNIWDSKMRVFFTFVLNIPVMVKIEDIKKKINLLPAEDFRKLRDWVIEKDWQDWNRELKKDSDAGKLDFLCEEAGEEYPHKNMLDT
jgi:hypothetical protein